MVSLDEQEKSVETDSETQMVPKVPEIVNSTVNTSAASLFAAANATSPTGNYVFTSNLWIISMVKTGFQ